MDKVVIELNTSEDDKALMEASNMVKELASINQNNAKVLFETEGLVGGLMRVLGKEGEGKEGEGKEGERFRGAKEEAIWAIGQIAYYGRFEVRKGLFEHTGLVDCLIGRMRNGSRLHAVLAIYYIACGDMAVKRGLFEHEGLVDAFIEILAQTAHQNRTESEYDEVASAVVALKGIADGHDEVKEGLFHFPGLMTRIEKILLDSSLKSSAFLRNSTTALVIKLLRWQHRSFRSTFEAYTLLLKLCNKKVPRAHSTSVYPLSLFLANNEDVGNHTLSFLESKNVDLNRAIDRVRDHGEIIFKWY